MAGGVTVDWIGTNQLIARLVGAGAAALPVLGALLYAEGLDILADTLPITPIDTGALRASGHVTTPTVTGQSVEVDVGFGGSAASYALFVHERLDARHAPPTQAKFLETVAMAHAATFAARAGAMSPIQL